MATGVASPDRHRRSDIGFLRLRVRLALGHGSLPPIGPSRAGRGTGKPCAVCGDLVSTRQVGYQVESPAGSLPAHVFCYLVWREQSEEWRRAGPA